VIDQVIATQGGFGANGRFSNGPVWHEYLADSLGISRATNSENGGNNYAFGGARVNNDGGVSAGILNQEDQYNNKQPGSANASDLYITWAGGNDIRDLAGATDPIAAINAQLDSFVGVMSRLVANGVGTLLVPNLPNLGAIPEFADTAASTAATLASQAWNAGLEQRLISLSATTSASIFYLDVFGIFGSILDDPTASGFTNTTDQCRSVSFFIFEIECANADEYLFWDEIHPTTAAHKFLGLEAFALLESGNALRAVPEPAVLWLMLLGFGTVVGRRAMVTKAA
ncbi:MAG TPA: SGNH/GDSL hydrolase family protein, partial [Marinobacter sp.]|nr:SGNH/GDSL hydrolase family protein [Marinobacter sp.]